MSTTRLLTAIALAIALVPSAAHAAPSAFELAVQRERPDFNGDARTDIAWVNAGTGAFELWLVNHTAFSPIALAPTPGAVIHEMADYDGDGKTDILWREANGAYRLDIMNGLAVVTTTVVLAGGSGWEVVGTGDFNADGKSDLLWKRAGQLGTWLMNGANPHTYSLLQIGPYRELVALADFDNDGRCDFISTSISHSGFAPYHTTITYMRGATATADITVVSGSYWRPIGTANLDGNGYADILWATDTGLFGYWLRNAGGVTGGVLRSGDPAWPGFDPGWEVDARLVRDLDGDGRDDLVWTNADGRVEAWLMDGLQPVKVKAVLPLAAAGSTWVPVATGDYDGDGRNDILWRDAAGASSETRVMNAISPPAYGSIPAPTADWHVAP